MIIPFKDVDAIEWDGTYPSKEYIIEMDKTPTTIVPFQRRKGGGGGEGLKLDYSNLAVHLATTRQPRAISYCKMRISKQH